MFSGVDLQKLVCVYVSHQVVDLIGQLHFLVCIFQSFVIVLEHREGLGCYTTLRMLLDDWL